MNEWIMQVYIWEGEKEFGEERINGERMTALTMERLNEFLWLKQ